MKKILIISYHFYPSSAVGAKRPSELAIRLSAEGYEVLVIAAKVDGEDELTEKAGNVTINYVPVPPDILKKLAHTLNKVKQGSIKNSSKTEPVEREPEKPQANPDSFYHKYKRRILSIFAITENLGVWSMMVLAVIFKIRMRNKIDLVITTGPPMVVHNLGYIAKKLFLTKWIMDLRDPPRIVGLINQDIKPKLRSELRKKIELFMEKTWLTSSDLITTTSPGIRNEIILRYQDMSSKIHVIYNGYDHLNRSSGKKNSNKKISFLYAGSLYFNRNPFPLLEGLKSLIEGNFIDKNDIEFLFYGHCESWNGRSLNEWIESNHMQEYITIHPPVTSEEINKIMCNVDILINFCQGQPLQIPAKTFDYMGTGIMSLVITEQESATATLIRDSGVGVIIDPNKDDIKNSLLEISNKYRENDNNKIINYEKIKCYSRDYQNSRYIELINKLGIM